MKIVFSLRRYTKSLARVSLKLMMMEMIRSILHHLISPRVHKKFRILHPDSYSLHYRQLSKIYESARIRKFSCHQWSIPSRPPAIQTVVLTSQNFNKFVWRFIRNSFLNSLILSWYPWGVSTLSLIPLLIKNWLICRSIQRRLTQII